MVMRMNKEKEVNNNITPELMYLELKGFEDIIKYSFKNKDYFVIAMTHSSFSNEHKKGNFKNNERLEFLGDAVLELATSDHIFKNFPNLPEGQMSKYRASIVCEPTLAYCARKISLEKYILLGKGEEITNGRERDSIVSDALEALIGAIYLDNGFDSASEFINKFILSDIKKHHLFYDAKSILQEIAQSMGREVIYKELMQEGPQHDKTFTMEVKCDGLVNAVARGKSKKSAQQEAAYIALKELKNRGIYSEKGDSE